MKKRIIIILTGMIAVGTASAAWWSFGSGEKPKEAPVLMRPQNNSAGMQRNRSQLKRNNGVQRKFLQLSEEQRAQIKATRQEIQKLVAGVRTETDPVKKAELTDSLRTKLTERAQKMQSEFQKRLERAENEVDKMKKRLAKEVKTQDQMIEEQLQRLLSGEKIKWPAGKGSNKKPHHKASVHAE